MKRQRWVLLAALLGAMFSTASACPVCYGDAGTSGIAGVNEAVTFLLGTTGVVLGGISTFFIFLWRRVRQQRAALSDSLSINESGLLHQRIERGVSEWKNI